MTRTFVAIELSEPARTHLRDTIVRLRRAIPAARWVDPAGLHLTLAFLGELDDARLAEVAPAAAEAAAGVAPFTLNVGALGTFGRPRAPRVIWAGVSGELRPLGALHRRLGDALARRGFALEARPYAPHLTLARVATPLPPEQLDQLVALLAEAARHPPDAPTIPATFVSVMRSELLRPVARYTRLTAVPLAPGKAGGLPRTQQAPDE
ncbi:MAG TPA: RNA 2',3'-cyclic phosphodiesterase [Ktedonobacterales bacterium]|nr:RNA 2',3'-cyclic phosphodiesterase [Ktedonobacterales bacterium]